MYSESEKYKNMNNRAEDHRMEKFSEMELQFGTALI